MNGPEPTIYDEVRGERERAHAKHGDKSMESTSWLDPTGRRYRILVEEVGEVAREFNDADIEGRPVDRDKLRAELIQVAAMAMAWADATGDDTQRHFIADVQVKRLDYDDTGRLVGVDVLDWTDEPS